MIYRILFGLILALFIPGLAFSLMLFPKKDDLDGMERMALSFILSLAVTPLLGLILNFTPFGIRLVPILVFLSVFTISCSLVVCFRWSKLPPEERFRVPFERLKFNLGQSVMDKVLSIVLIASILGSGVTLTYVAMNPRTGERFTEFYILDTNGTTSRYPTDLLVGDVGELLICIVNHEYENTTYRLKVIFNDKIVHQEHVFLIDNEKGEFSLTFKARNEGDNQKLEFKLYKYEEIVPYLTLYLWVNVT